MPTATPRHFSAHPAASALLTAALFLSMTASTCEYDPSEGRYPYQVYDVGEDLDGRRLSIQTDESGAYNVIIE
jgi:hypothetical protein